MQVLTHFPILKALGWALFNSLWQMAALWLVYVLLMAAFRKTAARIRHGIALLSLGAGACWALVTFCTAWLFPDNDVAAWSPFLSPGHPAAGWFWQTSHSLVDSLLTCGSTLYLVVLGGLLMRYSGHYRHSRNLTRQGLTTMPAEFRVFVSATALQLGIPKPVKAWLSSLIDTPLTLGFLKPVILLPAAMITQLTPQQVEAILIHELAHIQRRDYLLHLIVTLLEGLFFFNPFSRLLIRQLKKEREHCCDDIVLQFKYDPHAYVSALLSLAAGCEPVQKLAIAATGTGEKLLLQRARRILQQQKGESRTPLIRSLALLLFTLLIAGTALYHPLLQVRRPLSTATTGNPIAPKLTPSTPTTPRLAAAPREITSIQTIRSTPPPSALAHPRSRVHPRTPGPERPVLAGTDDNNVFVNSADDGSNPDGSALVLISADDADPGNTGSPDTRDYSLNFPSPTINGPAATIQQGAPYVPNSSFSYQYVVGDSTRPEEQMIYLQQSAQLEIMGAINKLQQQTAARLKTLDAQRIPAEESVHLRRQLESRQLKIQQDYINRIISLQKKLEKSTHIKVIVYI
jgi:beta-lactamase regulating signal transducer with metallopeptidase domain